MALYVSRTPITLHAVRSLAHVTVDKVKKNLKINKINNQMGLCHAKMELYINT